MKRLFDVILSSILLIVLLPILILIAILIRLESKGNPIFVQRRPGQYNKAFTIYKYRTMRIDTPDIPTNDFNDRDKYITKVGKFLRITSLDELPQLINILKGDMSFVGPRPPLFSQKQLIKNRKESGVNKIKPGITGWAQINGRDNIDDQQKFKYDLYYLKNYSFWLDLKIIFLTILKVIKSDDIIENEGNNLKL
ncbi:MULTISPECIES: sugar transferase [unclassified Candidatus Frackibacter]|uniref:sugar transferase n=1 Tax=unclassified Candidatus Frackibacter TaxID=2648818 RepID=UPI0008823738|nr:MULTISPECIES: sugar transferase [unclassified Candidatus Frackibacter]SDC07501.1 O-antigen biosynthesis protein WbqP [Candidatus Frackibacter sp. WG11]SEM38866.1 O-antigen biosynthesis protein WbqP [Candidatus Frackibacter sp. WG12]SFL44560.1 O-antigen biosynthesis protein WbqP [Candidatus Frackibacter sp. WG13]